MKLSLALGCVLGICLAGCVTTTETAATRQTAAKPTGFFEKLADHVTERECLVHGFSCPYGLGPAGEPCECTDPSGRVLQGRTIKLRD
jgi:hypothetical protein